MCIYHRTDVKLYETIQVNIYWRAGLFVKQILVVVWKKNVRIRKAVEFFIFYILKVTKSLFIALPQS